MVPLDVAIVVGAGDIGRVEIDQIDGTPGQFEDIRTGGVVAPSVVEDGGVENLDLFEKMLLDAELQIAAAVIVATEIPGHRENTARLPFQAGAEQGGVSQGLFMGILQLADVARNPVKKLEVPLGVENSVECLFDELVNGWRRVNEPFDGLAVEVASVVFDGRTSDQAGEIQEIGRHHAAAHGFHQVGHASGAGEGVQCRLKVQCRQDFMDPWQQPLLRAHVAKFGVGGGLSREFGWLRLLGDVPP